MLKLLLLNNLLLFPDKSTGELMLKYSTLAMIHKKGIHLSGTENINSKFLI